MTLLGTSWNLSCSSPVSISSWPITTLFSWFGPDMMFRISLGLRSSSAEHSDSVCLPSEEMDKLRLSVDWFSRVSSASSSASSAFSTASLSSSPESSLRPSCSCSKDFYTCSIFTKKLSTKEFGFSIDPRTSKMLK